MAIRISALPAASALTGAELIPVDQGSPAVTKRTTAAAIAALVSSLPANSVLINPTITNYTETLNAPAAGSAFTVDLTTGTIQKFTTNAKLIKWIICG
jgi:hypothetical protein